MDLTPARSSIIVSTRFVSLSNCRTQHGPCQQRPVGGHRGGRSSGRVSGGARLLGVSDLQLEVVEALVARRRWQLKLQRGGRPGPGAQRGLRGLCERRAGARLSGGNMRTCGGTTLAGRGRRERGRGGSAGRISQSEGLRARSLPARGWPQIPRAPPPTKVGLLCVAATASETGPEGIRAEGREKAGASVVAHHHTAGGRPG